MTKKQDYIKRMAITRILTWIRNTCLVVGIVNFLPLVIIADSACAYHSAFWLMFALASIMFAIVALIEFYVLYFLAHNGDMYFKPIFAWTVAFEDMSYKTWLKDNHLPNTSKNFNTYIKNL